MRFEDTPLQRFHFCKNQCYWIEEDLTTSNKEKNCKVILLHHGERKWYQPTARFFFRKTFQNSQDFSFRASSRTKKNFIIKICHHFPGQNSPTAVWQVENFGTKKSRHLEKMCFTKAVERNEWMEKKKKSFLFSLPDNSRVLWAATLFSSVHYKQSATLWKLLLGIQATKESERVKNELSLRGKA